MSEQAKETAKTEAPKVEAAKGETPVVAKAEAPAVDHLALIQAKADTVGVGYTSDDTVETIRARINAKLEGTAPTPAEAQSAQAAKTKNELRQEAIADATRLIRVRITNMDQRKADLPGEYFTVSNGVVGSITRYVPYNAEDGWHIENMLLENLKERQFYQLRPRKGNNGSVVPDGKWVKEFSIELLEPLSPEELKVLANKQAAAAGGAV